MNNVQGHSVFIWTLLVLSWGIIERLGGYHNVFSRLDIFLVDLFGGHETNHTRNIYSHHWHTYR